MGITIPQTTPDYDKTRIIERPDGFYWQDKDTSQEYGPFATLVEAVRDMEYGADSELEAGDEGLEDAESELGIAGWIDPDTGDPAEESIPHMPDY